MGMMFWLPIHAQALSVKTPQYGTLNIKEAKIRIEFPKNWFQQGKKTAWSPQRNGMPLIGFKWTKIKSRWDEQNMLPKGKFVGPFVIDLGWERGSLYLVQNENQIEIHAVITRQDAGLAYDFYAKGKDLAQLNPINFVLERIMHSGMLDTIKDYISKDSEECKEIDFELECGVNQQPFFDKTGCGCLIVPQRDAIFDN
jgi:hypothetical protein